VTALGGIYTDSYLQRVSCIVGYLGINFDLCSDFRGGRQAVRGWPPV